MLFEPFISVYMRNSDIEYNVPYLALLFCLIQILSSTRMVANNLISIAGHMPQTMGRSAIQAGINVVVSLALVYPLGIHGVLIGTVVSLLYRTNDIILYTDLKILKRNPLKSYKPVFINFALFGIAVWLEKVINLSLDGYTKSMDAYLQFVLYGVIYSAIIIPAYIIVNSLLAPKEFKYVIGIFGSKLKKRK